MYGVGVDVHRRAGRDIIATETIILDGLAHCHGDRRNIPQRFPTYIVQIMKIVSIEFGKTLDVIAGQVIEQERVMLLDLGSDTLLNFRMRCEQVDGPGNTSRRR